MLVLDFQANKPHYFPKVKFLQGLKFQLRFWLNCKKATFTDRNTPKNRRFMTSWSQFMVNTNLLLCGSRITKLVLVTQVI